MERPGNNHHHMSRPFRSFPTCDNKPAAIGHFLYKIHRSQTDPTLRIILPIFNHCICPLILQVCRLVRYFQECQFNAPLTKRLAFSESFCHFLDRHLSRSLDIPSTSFQRTDRNIYPAGPSAACPVAMVRIGAAGLRTGNDLALLSASPVRARAREVMTYRTAYALRFQLSASSAIIGIDVGRQQHIARAANPVHKIMSSARTRTHLPVAPSPFRVIGIAFEHHPIGAQMERRDGPRRIDTQRLSPIARNQADRNPLAVAVQIGRNIPPRGFGQNLQPAEPLVQTIKRQFRQIFDRPLARPVGYECSDKKAFFLVCMSTQTSMTKKL